MTAVKIKFCGLRTAEDVRAANACLPDFAGFVFATGRRRTVTAEEAGRLRAGLHPSILPVGVFVNESPDRIAALLSLNIIGAAQLHGEESEEEVAYLQKKCGKPVIRAFQIRGQADLLRAEKSRADLLLLDSGTGGGVPLPWEMLREFSRPYLLAGGLTPENVGKALGMLRPFGVDVSSGIETEGKKDPAKMRAFVCAVREIRNP